MSKCPLLTLLPLFVAACTAIPTTPFQPPATTKIACIGASITQGIGSGPGHNSYPDQLARMLGPRYEVKNFGASGSTMTRSGDSPYWQRPEFKKSHDFNPDVVIFLLGSNDSKPQNIIHQNQFRADCQALMDSYAVLPSHPRIFLCQLPPAPSPGNYGINEPGIIAENEILATLAHATSAGLIDTHSPLLKHGEMLPDHVHPTAAGAQIIAAAVYRALTGHPYAGPSTIEPAAISAP